MAAVQDFRIGEAQAIPEKQSLSAAEIGGDVANEKGTTPIVSERTTEQDADVQSTISKTASNGSEKAIKASPLARRMAGEQNIDLSQVQGTGPGGRIVRDDIEDVLEQRSASPAPIPAAQQAAPTSTALSEAELVKLHGYSCL